MEILNEIASYLEQGDDEKVRELTEVAIGRQIPAREVLERGLLAGMTVVGRRFAVREIFLPDVLIAAKAMYAGLAKLEPLLAGQAIPSLGKVVLGTVQGDLHDIGKNLVGIMLQGAGFEVIDLGNDVAPERFVEAARTQSAAVIGMSALLTTTMPAMGKVVRALRDEGLAGKVRVIVGGAPVSPEFAREIGADAYGYDAANAVERVKRLTEAAR